MYQIKTLNKISPKGLDLLSDKYTVVEDGDVDAIILRSFKMHDYALNANLKAVARAGAGTNNVPVDKCADAGIVVFNTPGANANGVKEAVLAGLLMSSRNIVGAIEWAKTLDGEGDAIPKLVEGGKSNFAGQEIQGKTLGVVGLGAIGVLVANAAKALGMKVVGYDPYMTVDNAWNLNKCVKRVKSLDEVYAESDYISVHVPLMDATKGMINEESIGKMKDGVRVLNFSRAGLIDDASMAKALEDEKVAYYVTDFPNQDSIKMKNVIAIPHLGASTPESEINCAIMAVNQLSNYLENGNIINSVNFPMVDMGTCSSAARISVIQKNDPATVTALTAAVAEAGLQIVDMANSTRGDYGYTLIDVDGSVDASLESTLSNVEGVIKVRVL